MPKKIEARVLTQTKVAAEVFELLLYAPQHTADMKAGQFVHVHCSFTGHTLLRRPISIHAVDKQAGSLSLLYRVVGEGTKYLSHLSADDVVDMIGPIGNAFPLQSENPLLIGGGLGVAPLRFAAQELAARGITPHIVLGFANYEQAQMAKLFEEWKSSLTVCTMDGSVGFHGNACQAVETKLSLDPFDAVYACGPVPMLCNLPKFSENTPVYVSLEERMACGVGACLGCAVPMVAGGYKHVCKDGPVFNLQEVILHG